MSASLPLFQSQTQFRQSLQLNSSVLKLCVRHQKVSKQVRVDLDSAIMLTKPRMRYTERYS